MLSKMKKRLEEIKNSNIGKNATEEFKKTIEEGDKMTKENSEFFRNLLT